MHQNPARMETWLERIAPVPRIAGWSRYDGVWVEPLRIVHDPELVIFEEGEFLSLQWRTKVAFYAAAALAYAQIADKVLEKNVLVY